MTLARTRGKWKHSCAMSCLCNLVAVGPLFPSLSTWTLTIRLWRLMATQHLHRIPTTEATTTMTATTMVKRMALDKSKVNSFMSFFSSLYWMTTNKLKSAYNDIAVLSEIHDGWDFMLKEDVSGWWCSEDNDAPWPCFISLILSLLLWHWWMIAQLAKRRIIKPFDVCLEISMLHWNQLSMVLFSLWQHYAGFWYDSTEYYKGFNNSIGTFGGVLQHINGKLRMDCRIWG